MKIMRLSSGLGNAMFQYAAYLQLKKLFPDEEVYLDTIWYDYTGYPYELNRIFSLNTDAVDIHKIIEREHGIRFEEQLEPLRFWKEYGFATFISFALVSTDLQKYTSRAQKFSQLVPLMNYAELPELERAYIKDLAIVSDQSYTLVKAEQASNSNGRKDYNTTPLRHFVKSFWKDKNATSYQIIKAISNCDRRAKFLYDVLHGIRPDFTGFPPISRLLRDGNVYFNIYGNPNDCEGIRDELLSAFTFPLLDSKRNQEIAKEIENCNSVAIHARVVDYAYGMKDAVQRGYYQKAVRYIKDCMSKNRFFVFSDDPDWCRANLNVLGLTESDPLIIIDWNKGTDSFRDMQLISLCKHQIIPNSTFSWWGGYLNRNPDKIFVTPYGTLPGTISF